MTTRPFSSLSLAAVGEALADAHRELGDMLAAELRAKVGGYQAALPAAKYVKDAEHYGALQALECSTEIAKLRGEIAALSIEWEYLSRA